MRFGSVKWLCLAISLLCMGLMILHDVDHIPISIAASGAERYKG